LIRLIRTLASRASASNQSGYRTDAIRLLQAIRMD
jgi:hypothetical protein